MSVLASICAQDGINLCDRLLVFEGQTLDDDRCLMDYDVPAYGMIFVDPCRYKVAIKTPVGGIVDLDVDPSFKFAQLKRRLVELVLTIIA